MDSSAEWNPADRWIHFPAHRLMHQVIFTMGPPENPFVTQVVDLRGEARREAIIASNFLPEVLANIVADFVSPPPPLRLPKVEKPSS